MKPSCFGKKEEMLSCESESCEFETPCFRMILGKLAGDGYLKEYYINGELCYKPTEEGLKEEKLLRICWDKSRDIF